MRLSEFTDPELPSNLHRTSKFSSTNFGVYRPVEPLMTLHHPCGAAKINRRSGRRTC
jgi:hypothetical protein